MPVPPAYESAAIDEAAEAAAAAAEAANIGGTVSDYAGPEGEIADRVPSARWPRPARASPKVRSRPRTSSREAAESTEGMSPEEHQIDDAIDAGRPTRPRPLEPVKPADDSEWNTWSGRSVNP